jgi:hypothetical protein
MIEVCEHPLWEALGYAEESSEEDSPVIHCTQCRKFGPDANHYWVRHPDLTPEWFQTQQGKQEAQANNDVNSESHKKGKKVERYKSPSPTFTNEYARVMDLIRKMIPCKFCRIHNHCVVDC